MGCWEEDKGHNVGTKTKSNLKEKRLQALAGKVCGQRQEGRERADPKGFKQQREGSDSVLEVAETSRSFQAGVNC